MLKSTLWQLFEETGRVDIYLAYREYQTRGSTYEPQHATGTYNIPKCVGK